MSNLPTNQNCPCKCHEPESVYSKGASGHCWVCVTGETVIAGDSDHGTGTVPIEPDVIYATPKDRKVPVNIKSSSGVVMEGNSFGGSSFQKFRRDAVEADPNGITESGDSDITNNPAEPEGGQDEN